MWHLPDPDCFWGSESLDLRNSTKPLNQRQSLSETPSSEAMKRRAAWLHYREPFLQDGGREGSEGWGGEQAAPNASGVKKQTPMLILRIGFGFIYFYPEQDIFSINVSSRAPQS